MDKLKGEHMKYLRRFKIIKFINKYRAISYWIKWQKNKQECVPLEMYLKRLKKYYLFTDKDLEFIETEILRYEIYN